MSLCYCRCELLSSLLGGIAQTGSRLTKPTDAGHASEYVGLQCLGMFQTMLDDVCGYNNKLTLATGG